MRPVLAFVQDLPGCELRSVQQASAARRREAALQRERKAALIEQILVHCGGAMRELREIAEVAYGLTVNQARRESTDTALYLTVANVTRGALRLEEVKTIGTLPGDRDRYRVRTGDVLLVEGSGNPRLLGSAAVWNDELPFALHQNHLIRARPDLTVVLPYWLMTYINSDAGRAQLLGRSTTSSGLHSINSRLISALRIPVPSLDVQEESVRALSILDALIAALDREAALLDELFRALLEGLMTGRIKMGE